MCYSTKDVYQRMFTCRKGVTTIPNSVEIFFPLLFHRSAQNSMNKSYTRSKDDSWREGCYWACSVVMMNNLCPIHWSLLWTVFSTCGRVTRAAWTIWSCNEVQSIYWGLGGHDTVLFPLYFVMKNYRYCKLLFASLFETRSKWRNGCKSPGVHSNKKNKL